MARYTGRQFPGSSSPSTSSGGFFSLGKQLAARRGLDRVEPRKVAPTKPSLTTSKQKEAEIKKMIDTKFMPSGMQLAKLRQLAAAGKILNPKEARDFLHRSQGGKKLDTREGLQKFETELLKAELQATQDTAKSPISYKFRQGGESHIPQKAKELVKGLYQASSEQAHQAAQSTKLNTIQQRQERLATLHAAMRPQTPTVAAPATPSVRTINMPGLQTIEPIMSSAMNQHRAGSSLVAPPTGVGSHVPDAHPITNEPNVGLGIPVVVHPEATTPQAVEPTAPAGPIFQEREPLDTPLPPHPVVPSESAPMGSDTNRSGTTS